MNKIFLMFLLFTAGTCFAELDQKAILLKQVNRFESRRQFDRANKVLLELMLSNSNDPEVAEKLVNNYLSMNKSDDAQYLLDSKKDIFSEINFVKLQISIFLRTGEAKEAVALSDDFINRNEGKIHYNQILASMFERYANFEQAAILYEQAVQTSNNEVMFSVELARSYQRLKEYDNSIRKYFIHLKQNAPYKNSHFNRIKTMLKEDESLIVLIREVSEKGDNPDFREIYALSLAEIGNFDEALEIYKTLNLSKLFTFANNQRSYGNLEIAERAYSEFAFLTKEPYRKADAEYESAKIKFQLNKLEECKVILTGIYNNKALQTKRGKYKTRTNRYAREMLGRIALIQNESEDVILNYWKEAKSFAANDKETKEIDFEIANYLIMSEKYNESNKMLAEILQNEDTSSSIFHLGYYYTFLSATMQNDASADSLLGELLISLPGSPLTNDALLLNFISGGQEDDVRHPLLQAFRKKKLYRTAEAVELLENKENESLRILAGEWALEDNDLEKAKAIFSSEFLEEPFADYSALKLTQINNSHNEAAEFLSLNPTSVFSPEFRKLMNQTRK